MADPKQTLGEQWAMVPGWFKVIIGIAGLLISWKMFPILELLNLFALIVLVPLCLLGSIGLIADGAGLRLLSCLFRPLLRLPLPLFSSLR